MMRYPVLTLAAISAFGVLAGLVAWIMGESGLALAIYLGSIVTLALLLMWQMRRPGPLPKRDGGDDRRA